MLFRSAIDTLDDEEATKAKVEKMQLGGVDDVRSVAGLMKTLEPVLEVSTPLPSPFSEQRFTSSICTSPDFFRAPTEDIIFPESTGRPADNTRGFNRGQPRVPPLDAVEYAINIHRQ